MVDGNAAENIAIVLAAVVAVSLALTQALGSLVVYLTEAIKSTGKVSPGYSGLTAVVVGMLLGMALGALTDLMTTDSYGLGTMLLLGAFAGALMAAGAIQTYKAVGEVNPQTTEPLILPEPLPTQGAWDWEEPDPLSATDPEGTMATLTELQPRPSKL